MPDPKKNVAYTFDVSLGDAANRPQFTANPTLATGDVKVSIDEGAFANLGTLPTVAPASGRVVKVVLAQAEMNGDRINVQFVDAAGAEWDELMVTIYPQVTVLEDVDAIVDAILADTADMQPKLGTPAVTLADDIAGIEGAALVEIRGPGDLGNRNPSDLIEFAIETSIGGVMATLTGAPAALRIYKDGSATQDLDGVTITVDFDGITGRTHVTLDPTADPAFYASGSEFSVAVNVGTVGGVSVVGRSVGAFFRIRKGAELMPLNEGELLKLTSGYVSPNWADIANPTTTVNLSGTTTKNVTDLAATLVTIGTTLAALPAAVWAALTSALTVTGSIGKKLADWLVGDSHIKRNQALEKYVFVMTNATTHAPMPGLTVTCTRAIDGAVGVVGTLTNIIEHPDVDGSYLVDFGAGDLDGKVIKFVATAAGADKTQERIITVP